MTATRNPDQILTLVEGEAESARAHRLPEAVVDSYRRNGFVLLRGVLTAAEIERYSEAAAGVYDNETGLKADDAIFKQVVNVWQDNPALAELTMHPALSAAATQLAGIPLRLWHDQLLMKRPHNHAATEYHQDAPYWPHSNSRHSLSAWIALVDVPLERGCMSFIPEQQGRHDLRAVDLTDATDLFEAAPDLVYEPRVTLPLKAGDVTFHNGFTPHTANPNDTDLIRLAHVVIYVDHDLTYDGRPHVCTDPLNLEIGQPLPDAEFPPLPS